MNDKKGKKTLSNDDLLGLIVHSYNNYLAGIMGFSELAMLECENSNVQDKLNLSMGSGIDAVHFGKTILASLGRLQVPMRVCSLVERIQAVAKKQQSVMSESELQALEGFKIKTDPQWFEECLLDLIEFVSITDKNDKPVLKFTVSQQDTPVTISIHCKDFSLEDEDVSHLFEPFYSSRKLTGKKDIGLAKSKGFFAQMNANLSWENKRGFVLEIPVESPI